MSQIPASNALAHNTPPGNAQIIASANDIQRLASDPLASVFVSASAGSGKTKLLIDRLLRLMLPVLVPDPQTGSPVLLPGCDPARIQCLTFTRAAAAEMANRLQSRLGRWVSLPDAALDGELHALSVPVSPETRQAARALFVRVLDLPGGMKIGTIHAFCQSLLRRFPLEAAINPHFTLMEETDSGLALANAIEQTLSRAARDPVMEERLSLLAGQVGLEDYLDRIRALQGRAARLRQSFARWQIEPGRIERAYRRAFDAGEESLDDLLAQRTVSPDEATLRRCAQEALPLGTPTMQAMLGRMLDALSRTPQERDAEDWYAVFVTGTGTPRAAKGFVPAAINRDRPHIMEAFTREAERQIALGRRIAVQRLIALNLALFALAAPTLERYAQDKTLRGLVDYDDLIASTRDLLRDPGASWVLYKLDGGLDHLLLDEVQDTSAAQWEIATALIEEFFVGESARDMEGRPRTVFAVGDFKQSIYAFQGADPQGLFRARDRFRDMVIGAAQEWRTPEIGVSFRSVAPVLDLVDAVFTNPLAADGLREPGRDTLPPHRSARPGQGGRVELWPLVPKDEKDGIDDPWAAPTGNAGQSRAPQKLADHLAQWIAAQIGKPPQPGQTPLRAGEVLVLVPRRSSFLRALIRALKGQGVEVATLVGVGLTDSLAVQDMMALCHALLLPQDNLTLAAVLTSPFGGVSDHSLMDLAMERGEIPLWTALRERHRERPEWQSAWERLSALQTRIDFATPYQILADALGRHEGRARALARLGPEAAEPLDDLLSAALRFEALHAPSMQGFLHWLASSSLTVKREAEAEIDAVRIMTVHGSKGLQARLVVLPDMTGDVQGEKKLLWTHQNGLDLPVWMPGKELASDLGDRLKAEEKAAAQAERNRLLYVALTRASDWLVVCGWEPRKKPAETSWYALCEAGFQSLAAVPAPFEGGWEGETLIIEAAPAEQARQAKAVSPVVPDAMPAIFGQAPEWHALAAPQESPLTRPLAPSRPDNAQYGAAPPALSPLRLVAGRENRRARAIDRGTLVHRLLQWLPDRPEAEWRDLAHAWLSHPSHDLLPDDVTRLVGQVLAILTDKALAPLFGPGSLSEQPVTGVAFGQVVLGQVDRLCVSDSQIMLCDYKTGQNPPRPGQAIPAAYRRQMEAYGAVLKQIYPDHELVMALVWTEGPTISFIPPHASS
ncbi:MULTISPECIES: double-strand break repair helicase AddA [Asaia]|uniref:DNA 3'-5' helicase n=1 Tax=Asaia bogorensis TaxID=91915 RepID=A0A060QI20_9PROT|nr:MULTISPECIES: double-strand break repair helicase AddA [Asaia]ETC98456.1 DNA helicase II [Asaia sp. SF2.1]CDG38891.1 ATP-dependent nuclease subunit A [Asaia bogorensis]